MRIVVSGSHATGKSTLIADFTSAHQEFAVLPDPYELLESADDVQGSGSFFGQLLISAQRLIDLERTVPVIAERGPLDFLAYLDALEALGRPDRSSSEFQRGISITAEAMRYVDLIVYLPIDAHAAIEVPADEDPELRLATDFALLNLLDDPDLVGETTIVELAGDASQRLSQLEVAAGVRPGEDA